MDEGRVKGDAISIECDCGELKVQGIVVPLVIADLGVGKGRNPSVTSCSRNKALPHLLGGRGQALVFPAPSTGLTGVPAMAQWVKNPTAEAPVASGS